MGALESTIPSVFNAPKVTLGHLHQTPRHPQIHPFSQAKIQKSKIRKPKYGKSFYSEKGDPLKKALKPGAAPADTLSVSQ